MTTRVEQDRHYFCSPGACVAPAPRKLAAGRKQGRCVPRKTWWLRTVNSVGKRVSIAFRSEQEAREAARKVEAARILGQDYTPRAAAAPRAPLFREIAEQALKLYSSTRSLRPSTVENRESFLRSQVLPHWGAKEVIPANFSRLALREWIADLRDKKTLADSTLHAYLPVLTSILDYAVERELLAVNPMRGGEPLWRGTVAAEEVDPFTPADLRKILVAARAIDPDFATCCQIMMQTSLRPGEALGLRRCDIDFVIGMVAVVGTWSRKRYGPPKTRSSVRKVSLLYPVTEDTPAWRPGAGGAATKAILEGLRHLRVLPADPEGRLFTWDSQDFSRLWHRVLAKTGVRYRKPHATRHSFASILLSRGANLLAIQRAGGWKSAQILLSTYAKWIEDASTDASSGEVVDLKKAVNFQT
jgi:integrase